MPHQQMSTELDACIQACLDCYRTCQQTAAVHCLEMGGRHVEPDHMRLMLDCAEICRTSAALMLNQSRFHHQLCGVCADVCRACADSCRGIGGMDDCVQACERCAEHCERMAGAGGGRQTQQDMQGESMPAH